MTYVKGWVQELTEAVIGGPPFKAGDIVKHPDGRTVQITGGQLWGEYGISNWWYWQELKPDGTLGPQESGYGWNVNGPRTNQS